MKFLCNILFICIIGVKFFLFYFGEFIVVEFELYKEQQLYSIINLNELLNIFVNVIIYSNLSLQ